MLSDQAQAWRVGPRQAIKLDRPRLIAILNVTPDSFFDGGRLLTVDEAVGAAERAVSEGADAVDVGGESTRPGASRVPADEQVRRTAPVIEAVRARGGRLGSIPITIDTTLAPVAAAAIKAGADAINDVSAGREDEAMFRVAAEHAAGLILMHRLAPPERDSYSDRYRTAPEYHDVVAQVRDFLRERAVAAVRAGVARDAIVVDPGLGFGKTVEQNLELIRGTPELMGVGFPVLSALSRKSFVGRASGLGESGPEQRLEGTLGLSVTHLAAGARLFRVHDVAPHARALGAAWAALGGPVRRASG
jgi:dihydropteroate synthase